MHPSALCCDHSLTLALKLLKRSVLFVWADQMTLIWMEIRKLISEHFQIFSPERFVGETILKFSRHHHHLDTHGKICINDSPKQYVCAKVSSPTCTLIVTILFPFIQLVNCRQEKEVKNIQSFNETCSRHTISSDRFVFLLLFFLSLLAPVVVSSLQSLSVVYS
jgi:hypothetical protein